MFENNAEDDFNNFGGENMADIYDIDHPLFKESGTIAVTSPFGPRDGGFHYGLDTTLWKGTYGTFGTIQAFADGKVIDIWDQETDNKNYQQSSGNRVMIDHGNGYQTRYYHLAKGVTNYVKLGQIVKKGDAVGYMGNTGHSFGGHLHLEVRINGTAVDPLPYVLGEKTFDTSFSTEVKTYQVTTTINGYNTADNAQKQTNSTVKIAPGTYYILNKYPNGVNGM